VYTIYIIQCQDGSLYTGIARDLTKRYQQHCEGTGARYTKAHPPKKIIYTEKKRNRSNALKREAEIKKLSHEEKISLANI